MNAPRRANRTDAPAMVEMLNHYIAHSTTTFLTEPQTLAERLAWFDKRSEIYPAIVLEVESVLIAWGALSAHNFRNGYRHTADVSVYVRPEFHRRGIGRLIVTDLITRARLIGHHALIAICCSESVSSIALHESLGFRRVAKLHEIGRKFDRWLDELYLELLL